MEAVLTTRAESASAAIAAVNPPKPAAASGLLQGALEGEDEDGKDDDDDDDKIGADVKSGGPPNKSRPNGSQYTLEADPRRQEEKEKE